MFGYLTAALPLLNDEQKKRYGGCYCGLCRALRDGHGQLKRLTLNYDLTFLVLLLNSLYEPEEESGERACALHPIKPHSWWRSEVSDYAADMNVALAYYKCLDDWDDELDPISKLEAALLKSDVERIAARYPRQCAAIGKSIAALSEVERRGGGADEAGSCFGELMGEIFVYREDRWSNTLRALGRSLGKFIYVMDACLDLENDVKRGCYNPFRSMAGDDNEEAFRDILKMLLGDCLRDFDRLPLVKDADVMKNILCAGLWTQFAARYKKETEDV